MIMGSRIAVVGIRLEIGVVRVTILIGGDRRHGGLLNCLKVRVHLNDQSQIEVSPLIRIAALRMSPVELPYVPILLKTITKALWDTGAEKSLILEDTKNNFFTNQLRSHTARS
ncbi:hypothetical protein TNCV_4534681 [Trichonephila clavipes]|nr:hypothetical protein TNCV_4534681 [Trichonephila clavipes]